MKSTRSLRGNSPAVISGNHFHFNNFALLAWFRDVSGEGVQQGLLKLLEGSVVSVKDPFKKPAAGNIQGECR
jgi:hypothetical protein